MQHRPTTVQASRHSEAGDGGGAQRQGRGLRRWLVGWGLALLCGLGLGSPSHSGERGAWLRAQLSAADGKLPAAVRDEKYAVMSTSALAFFRGSAHLFWQDLGKSPQLAPFGGVASTRIWLVGDAHPNNFASLRNARGALVYDLNDFDESVIADYQLDLWRMATALVLLMRENGGFAAQDEARIVEAFSERYLNTLEACVGTELEKTATLTADNAYGKLDDFLRSVANKKSQKRLLETYTQKDESGARVLSPQASPDLAAVPSETVAALRAAMPAYGASLRGGLTYSAGRFTVKSVAQRLHAGLGSLGSSRYYVQIEGETTSPDDDVILDIKLQGPPSAYRSLAAEAIAATEAAAGGDPARRVVTAARSLGNYVDDYLGVMKLSGASYSVRERSAWKDYLDVEKLRSVERMSKLAEQWAAILAFAHARADRDAADSGIRYDFEKEVTERTRGKRAEFHARLRSIALAQAAQVTDDYRAFLRDRPPVH